MFLSWFLYHPKSRFLFNLYSFLACLFHFCGAWNQTQSLVRLDKCITELHPSRLLLFTLPGLSGILYKIVLEGVGAVDAVFAEDPVLAHKLGST